MERNCRMCLVGDRKNQFQRFSHKLEDSLSVYDYYKLFTSVNLRNQDERTKSKICYKCLQKLLIFYNDRCKAITNNEIISKWCDEAIDPFAGPQDPSELVKVKSQLLSIEIIVDPLDECSDIEKVKIEDDLFVFGEAADVILENGFKNGSSKLEPAKTFSKGNWEMIVEKFESLTKPCHVLLERCDLTNKDDNEAEDQSNTEPNQSNQEEKPHVIKPTKLNTKFRVTNHSKNSKKKVYPVTCSFCGISVRSDSIQKHINCVHLKVKRFFCKICSKGFYANYLFKEHMKYHEEPTVPCPRATCKMMFCTKSQVMNHIVTAHTKHTKSYPCTYCDKLFERASSVNLHIKFTHLKIRKHVCPNCGLGFSSRGGLREHMSKYLEKRFICDGCGLRFNSKKKLRYHYEAKHFGVKLGKIELIGADNREIGKEPIKVARVERNDNKVVRKPKRGRPKKTSFNINPKPIQHSTVEPTENGVTLIRNLPLKKPAKKLISLVICQTCGITARSDSIQKHINCVHGKVKRFFCDACPRGFYQQYQLRLHTMVHEGDPTIPCTFENCMKMFYTKNLLNKHIWACHTENKDDYPCSYPECSKTFQTAHLRKCHIIKAHLKIRDHVCPYCEDRFTSKQVLIQHIARHEEKKFICDRCGKSFATKVMVGAHFKQAHWDPPLACSFCGKKYKRYQNHLLRNHELNHQNIRNHPCEICTKAFQTNVFKMEHIRAVHFKSKIKCELCGRSFPRPGYYKVHVKEKHEDLRAERIQEWLARIDNIRPDYDKLEWVYE